MFRPLLLRGARQLLTLHGAEAPRRGPASLDLGIIHDGSVLIDGGRIVSVGQSRRVDNLAAARTATVHEVHGCVVMPGLVDASATLPATPALVRRFAHLAFTHGSTTIGACGPYASLRHLAAESALQAAFVHTLEVPAAFDQAQVARAARRNLAQFLRLDLLVHSRTTLQFVQGLGPAIRAYTSDAANPDWLGLALAFGASVLDIEAPLNRAQSTLLADSAACALLTPAALPYARSLLDHGAAVGLGTGFLSPTGYTCSMLAALQFAARDHNLDIAEAITLATVNAAFALGISGLRGSIEAGKQADLLILHLSDYRDLVNYTGVNVVSNIVKAGILMS